MKPNIPFPTYHSGSIETLGSFTVSKSDRRSVRQNRVNSGKKFTKKLPPVGFDLPTATITALKSEYLTNKAIQTCVEWEVLNKFCFMHHFTFWTWVISGINRV